ncbi:type II toxin-antitoxin system HicA family toxin [Candidatus Poribacteria bacterium]|nr:type II toxin-antitoxin system HicA family toxin [Candidatus Poribacteria bacterium]
MNRTPTISARIMIAFLNSLGFELVRQKGSHKFFKHSDGRTVVVPEHKGEDLGRGIMNKIFKDIEVTQKDFIDWYQR